VEAWRFSATIEPAKSPASAAVAQHAEPEQCPWSSYRSYAFGEVGAAKLNQQREIKIKTLDRCGTNVGLTKGVKASHPRFWHLVSFPG